jgi:hypothetical protein
MRQLPVPTMLLATMGAALQGCLILIKKYE